MKRITGIVAVWLVLGVFLSAGFGGSGDDLYPAPWRNQPCTTYQAAEFEPGWNLEWDAYLNTFGEPSLWMYGDTWSVGEGVDGHSGVISWTNGPNGFSMDLPNCPNENLDKRIWVQLVYQGDAPTIWEVVGMDAQGATIPGCNWSGTPAVIGSTDLGGGWIAEAREIVIHPNPVSEYIGIRWTGPGMVDKLVVETICVPEPATLTLALAGLAALAVARLRRR